jgi:ribonuclease BN (tRNA processing enzyme)
VVDLAHKMQVKSLYLFHLDPDQDNDTIDAKFDAAKRLLSELKSDTEYVAPAESDTFKIQ